MLSRLSSIAAAALLAASGSAFAGTTAGSFADRIQPLAGATFGLEPPSSVIVAHGGKEWIWAAPCASADPSCGKPTPHHGFADPTAADWATWADRAALIAAFTTPSGGPLCGSPWMSSFHSHCDYSDMTHGHIWHAGALCDPAYFDGCVASTTETFYVRGVPEPETYALMLAGLGLVGFMARRRQQQAA